MFWHGHSWTLLCLGVTFKVKVCLAVFFSFSIPKDSSLVCRGALNLGMLGLVIVKSSFRVIETG